MRTESIRRATPAVVLCDAHAAEVFAGFAALPGGGVAPEWIQLLPLGEVALADSRGNFQLANAQAVIQRSMASGRPLVIDFDHATDRIKAGEALTAPAAGWITELRVQAGFIEGRVEWTPKGKAALENKAYRFVSPVFTVPKKGSRDINAILRAALTNDPAIVDLRQLASRSTHSSTQGDHDTMNLEELLKRLRAALGTDDKADVAKIMAAIESLVTGRKALTALGRVAGLAETAAAADIETAVTAAIKRAQPDPNTFVPRADFDAVKTQLATAQTGLAALQTERNEEKAVAAVDAAVREGKVVPAQRDYWLGVAKKDLAMFTTWCASAPVIVKGGSNVPGGPPPGDEIKTLTDDEKAFCARMGVAEDKYLATKKENAARLAA